MIPPTLLAIFDNMEIESDSIAPATRLRDELGMDSQEIVELLYAIEQVCQVAIPNLAARLGEFVIVSDLIALIEPPFPRAQGEAS